MEFVDQYRNPSRVKELASAIHKITTKPWSLMEVCGGQTHSILRYGLDHLLPKKVELLHGPGCPVCVTAPEILDQAFELALKQKVILCTFGDMMRVPGSQREDFFQIRAQGGDIRMVYSPLESVKIAKENPDKQVVFLAVGFETTAPAHALAVLQAQEQNIKNFSLLVSHVLVPPAIEMIMQSANNKVQGFLAAGHVCTVMGYEEYIPLSEKWQIPIVVTGFEPTDILEGIYLSILQLEQNRAEVENQYIRSVKREGNQQAMNIVAKVFEVTDRAWRGIGSIEKSGLQLRQEYKEFDANFRFGEMNIVPSEKKSLCRGGDVLLGHIKPYECPAFGKECTPESPIGPTMISTEGACSSYYRYRRS